jgi:cbb3-type cytochrome oxidase subunit 3
MMEGPWLGLAIMVVMIVGLIWWCWWAMAKKRNNEE